MMNRIVLGISLAIALGCLISPLGAKEPGSKASGAIYARPYEPPTRSAFLPLPPGCVEPQGWLRDWCLAARDGATGHLDEIDQTGKCKRLYDQTWTPDTARLPDMATRDPMDFFPHPMPDNEVVAYWLDGMVRLGYVLHDDFLTAKARSRLDVIAEKTTKDSLLFMWWINRNDQEFLKRLGPCAKWLFDESPDDFYYALQYCSANIGHALTACYAATGDERVLRASGQPMAASTAGSIVISACRTPLRLSKPIRGAGTNRSRASCRRCINSAGSTCPTCGAPSWEAASSRSTCGMAWLSTNARGPGRSAICGPAIRCFTSGLATGSTCWSGTLCNRSGSTSAMKKSG